MFGYVIINKGDLKFKEFAVYHSYYCGLCRKLKEKYGIAGQATLSYDLTFVIMLLSSLYEPENKIWNTNCAVHPFEKHGVITNCYTEYAADMNMILTYFKCEDDWKDEKKYFKKIYGKFLKSKLSKKGIKYQGKIKMISSCLKELSENEKNRVDDVDRMSGLFGKVMAEIMVAREDEWSDSLRRIGYYLGKFIYLLDAYEDLERDLKEGLYNPFYNIYREEDFEEHCRIILTMMMAECSKEFEKLPIVDNIEILRNILYSGVWYRYDKVREKRDQDKGEAYE